MSDFTDMLDKFDILIRDIEHLPESVEVGAIVLFTGKKLLALPTLLRWLMLRTFV